MVGFCCLWGDAEDQYAISCVFGVWPGATTIGTSDHQHYHHLRRCHHFSLACPTQYPSRPDRLIHFHHHLLLITAEKAAYLCHAIIAELRALIKIILKWNCSLFIATARDNVHLVFMANEHYSFNVRIITWSLFGLMLSTWLDINQRFCLWRKVPMMLNSFIAARHWKQSEYHHHQYH